MIQSVDRYRREGWTVRVNNNHQVVFTNPDGKFFTLTSPTNKEIDYINARRNEYGFGLRTRHAHR